MLSFEEREGMEGVHTPEMDLTRHHQVLEEGEKFESSVVKHLLCALWNELRLASVGFAFQEEKASCFGATASSQDSLYHGWEKE